MLPAVNFLGPHEAKKVSTLRFRIDSIQLLLSLEILYFQPRLGPVRKLPLHAGRDPPEYGQRECVLDY
jgi:hypothetical protein